MGDQNQVLGRFPDAFQWPQDFRIEFVRDIDLEFRNIGNGGNARVKRRAQNADHVVDVFGPLRNSGELQEIFGKHGITYVPPAVR